MKRYRLSLTGLIAVVAVAAIGLAAFRSATNAVANWTYTAICILLILGAIAARYRGPFWYGFAVAGWAYFLLDYGPLAPFNWNFDPIMTGLNGRLPYSQWLKRVVADPETKPNPTTGPEPLLPSLSDTNSVPFDFPQAVAAQEAQAAYWTKVSNRIVIAHCLFSLTIASAGGLCAIAIAVSAGRRVTADTSGAVVGS